MKKIIGKIILFSGILLCSMLIATHIAKAVPGPGAEEPDAGPEPSIISVFVDFTGNSIFINGEAFGTDPLVLPIVELATVPITVISHTDTFIEATLPPGTADGDYLLTVGTEVDNDTYNLTIGAVGPQGDVGPAGIDGAPGTQGPAGSAGADGTAGSQGLIGLTGATGPTGPAGPAGPAGPQGPQGNPGAIGSTGPVGGVGPTGPQGLNGLTGETGSTGAIGATGAKGLNWKGPWLGTTTYVLDDAVEHLGSSYLASGTTTLGIAPPGAGWDMLAMKGNPGVTGADGLAGADGAPGTQGPAGPAGANGPAGPQGLQGPTGLTGATGSTGLTGAQGPQGLPGPSNINGTTNFVTKFTGPTTLGDSIIYDNGANVGIGTTNPSSSLLTVGDYSLKSRVVVRTNDIGVHVLTKNQPSKHAAEPFVATLEKTTLATDDRIQLRFLFVANNDVGTLTDRRFFTSVEAVVEDPNFSTRKAGLRFLTGGRAAQNLEQMRITGDGDVGIGTTTPSAKLHVIGSVICSAGCTSSSRALKHNIRDLGIEKAMEALEELRPSRFVYNHSDEEEVGFIAEDVPDLVAKKGRKGLDAMDIVAVLTKVVQQQRKEIAELRTTVAGQEALRAEVTALKAQMTQLISHVLADKPLKTEVTVARSD